MPIPETLVFMKADDLSKRSGSFDLLYWVTSQIVKKPVKGFDHLLFVEHEGEVIRYVTTDGKFLLSMDLIEEKMPTQLIVPPGTYEVERNLQYISLKQADPTFPNYRRVWKEHKAATAKILTDEMSFAVAEVVRLLPEDQCVDIGIFFRIFGKKVRGIERLNTTWFCEVELEEGKYFPLFFFSGNEVPSILKIRRVSYMPMNKKSSGLG